MTRNTARHRILRTHRAISLGILLATVAIVALHAGLLWQRFVDQTIVQPGVMARWAVAAALALGALALRRIAGSSRSAWLVFWAIVVLLHVIAPGGAEQSAQLAVLTETVLAGAPLLMMFVAAALATNIGIAQLSPVRTSGSSIAGLTAQTRDRAPPRC
ncbi:MAG: hypothetical protein M3P06_15575 [Acidobacteriota bacterium]|nr:hypothetical protein [Acidobacteriota bacterium]